MDFLLNRAGLGMVQPSMRDKLCQYLGHAMRVSFVLCLLGGAACLVSSVLSSICPECINFARIMAGLLITTGLIAGLMAFARPESASTESKVIMHPWSIAELVEISLTTGRVTIGVIDIVLVYGYHVLLAVNTAAAFFGTVLLFESAACLTRDAILYWTIFATCAGWLLGMTAFLIMIFATMPYGFVEYAKIYACNLGCGCFYLGSHLKSKILAKA